MKLLISSLSMASLSLLNSGLALAADCPDPSYTLTTQAEVDDFPADCDTVTGNLTVEGDGITNLNGLANLSVVGGNLEIIKNPGIRFLRLPGLTRVDGYFQISANKALLSIDGLTNLSTVKGELSVSGDNLSSLEGLEGLVTTGGLFLHNAPYPNLDALGNLREAGYITLQSLPDLQNVDGLSNITRTSTLTLGDLGSTNLDGLRNIVEVSGSLVVSGTGPSTLDGLSGLNKIGSIYISNSTGLVDIDGLAGVTGVLAGRLEIRGSERLTNIDGLSGLTAVTGTVLIVENDSLQSIFGLRNLKEVDEDFIIANNPAIQSVPTLSLRFVRRKYPGGLQFWGNGDRNMDCSGFRRVLGYPLGPPYDGVVGQIEFRRDISRNIGGRTYTTIYQNCGGSYHNVVTPLHRPEKMAELYIGFLGRAPDPAGLVYWTNELRSFGQSASAEAVGLKKLARDIAVSEEWYSGIGRHNPLTQTGAEAIVAEMYLNLFSRPATASDLEYWSYDLTSQHVTAAQMAVLLIAGAEAKRNADWIVLEYKHSAALHYAARVNDVTFSRSTARLAVKGVNSSATLQASKDASDKL